MPNVNPPVDRAQADGDPELVLVHEAAVARVGPRRQCDTLPRPCTFRFAVLRTGDGQTYAGYLWGDD